MAPAVILIVDDDSTRQMLVSQLLSQAGFQILPAFSGQQGLLLSRERPPDLFLIGELSSDMSIDSFRQQVKADASLAHIPVIVLSECRRPDEAAATSLDVAVDEYIVWPADPKEFISRINTLLKLKQAEDRLREIETFQHQLNQAVTSGIAVYEVQGDGERVIFKDMNPAGERISRVRRIDILGRDVRDVFPSVIDLGFFDLLVRVWRTGEPERLPSIMYQDESISLWTDNYVYRLPYGDIVAVYDDITDEVRTKKVLGETQDLLQAVFDTDPNSFFVKDEEGRYVLVNQAMADLYGSQAEDMIGRTDFDLVDMNRLSSTDAEIYARSDRSVLQDGMPTFIPQEHFILPDGISRWFQTVKIPLTYGNKDRYLLGVAVDITDRKLAEEALRRSQTALAEAQKIAHIGNWDWDAITGKTEWSDEIYRILGLEPQSQPPSYELARSFIHPDYEQVVDDHIGKAGAGQTPLTLDYRSIRADGAVRWLRIEARIERDAGDQAIHVTGTLQDVTDIKLAEQTTRDKNAELESILRALPDALVYVDTQRRILEINPAFSTLFGYSQNEIEGRTTEFLYAQESTFLQTGKSRFNMNSRESYQPYEVEYQRKDGSIFPSETVGTSVFNAAGESIGFIGLIHNISDRMAAEEALRASEERYRLLAENATDVIWTMDLQGRFTYVSPSVEKLRGYTVEEVLHQTMTEALIPESLVLATQEVQRAIEAAQAGLPSSLQQAIELEQPTKDGSTVWTEVVSSLIFDRQGNVTGVQGVSRDITERKQLEAQIMEAQRMEAVGQLATGLAHDFNNLLTGVIGFAELLQMEVSTDDPRRHMVDVILKSGNRAAQLVQQLLAFARKQMVKPQILDLNVILKSLNVSMQQALGPTINMKTDLFPDLWLTLLDPAQAEQIVRDLIANARRAMPKGGTLRIETRNLSLVQPDGEDSPEGGPGDYVVVIFQDTGPVLPSEHQSRIFEPFFFTSREVADGTGLRLAAVYGIVRQNGGHIHVTSLEGEGTRLELRLPRQIPLD